RSKMLALSAGARWDMACWAGRALGRRLTDGRSFTGRRSAERATTWLAGSLGDATFLRSAVFALVGFRAGLRAAVFVFLAALRLVGAPLPDPFPVVFLAMSLSRCLFSATFSRSRLEHLGQFRTHRARSSLNRARCRHTLGAPAMTGNRGSGK